VNPLALLAASVTFFSTASRSASGSRSTPESACWSPLVAALAGATAMFAVSLFA
jgi:hypothetical protein